MFSSYTRWKWTYIWRRKLSFCIKLLFVLYDYIWAIGHIDLLALKLVTNHLIVCLEFKKNIFSLISAESKQFCRVRPWKNTIWPDIFQFKKIKFALYYKKSSPETIHDLHAHKITWSCILWYVFFAHLPCIKLYNLPTIEQ